MLLSFRFFKPFCASPSWLRQSLVCSIFNPTPVWSVGAGQRLYFQRTIRFSSNTCFSRRIRADRFDRRSIEKRALPFLPLAPCVSYGGLCLRIVQGYWRRRQPRQIGQNHNRHHYRICVGNYCGTDVDGDSRRKISATHVRGWDAASPFTSYMTGSIWLLSAAALLLLYIYKRTSLAVWLMVTVVATLPDLTLSTVMTSVRFTLGWYTARTYALIASCTVLAVMLTETTVLYARLANAILLLRRERANRLMSLDAATSAMAHELRQPLTAIAARSAAASRWLKRSPPDLEEARASLASISDSTNRAEEIISGVRELFKKRGDHRTMIHVDDVARQVLTLVEQDLLLNNVSVATEFQNDLPEVYADRTQIQQVILNLVRNAIDAMATTVPRATASSIDDEPQWTFVRFAVRSGRRTWNRNRKFRPRIRAVLHDEARRHGIGTFHLSDYRPGPRWQFEASQDGLRWMRF